MKCPIDQSELVMTERQGVEIDYCPKCRGVWLDRGEIDKIIERSLQPGVAAPHRGASSHDDCSDRGGYGHGQRRRGWLGDLFD